MRIERWYWLPIFMFLSLAIHVGIGVSAPRFGADINPPKRTEIEVTLEAPAALAPAPEKPKTPAVTPTAPTRVAAITKSSSVAPTRAPEKSVSPLPSAPVARPTKSAAISPETLSKLESEKPRLGLPSAPDLNVRPANPARLAPRPVSEPSQPAASTPEKGETPESPTDLKVAGSSARPDQDTSLPMRDVTGGGKTVLSADNPLKGTAIPEEKPGLTSGAGGGAGGGKGPTPGRINAVRAPVSGSGVGGNGSGAANVTGSGGGSGPGTGVELPKVVGESGKGGAGGTSSGSRKEASLIGKGDEPGGILTRGVPFGDLSGMVKKDGGGGKSGGQSGGKTIGDIVFRGVHIVYLLDSSGSMFDGDKIGKAKAALKQAVSELKPEDTFNIIHFDGQAHYFAQKMQFASSDTVERALGFTEKIRLQNNTNISSAFEAAFKMERVSHIFLLSDGLPTKGIVDQESLLKYVYDLNNGRARVLTLALTLGEQFEGATLLKRMALENRGMYSVLNLSRQ